jgi:hypothetical protein
MKESTMANTKRTIEDIRSTEDQSLTPYEVFRILQDGMQQGGFTEAAAKLRPQMMYNYDRNGGIVKGYTQTARNGLAGRYTVEQADAFATRYIAKNYTKWTNAPRTATVDPFANVEQIIAENTECEGQEELEFETA